jgi:hypothetical protein
MSGQVITVLLVALVLGMDAFSLNGRFTIYDVSLKDIFLSVNEGGMQYESFNQRV